MDPSPAPPPPARLPPPSEVRVHEVKFLLDAATALRVLAWAREHLGGPARTDVETTLLFLDTPRLDSARKTGELGRDRYRVRGESGSDVAVLERKTKKKDGARIRSYPVPLADLVRLGSESGDPAWPGHAFHVRVVEHGLRPVCRATWLRTTVSDARATTRVALDHRLRATSETGWSRDPVRAGDDLLGGRVLVEARATGPVPPALRALVSELALVPTPFSKYRASLARLRPAAEARP